MSGNPQRGGGGQRGGDGGRGRGQRGGSRGDRGDRGGGSFRGDRGGSSRGDRGGGGNYRGDRGGGGGGGGFRGDRGGGFRGDRGGRGGRGGGQMAIRGPPPGRGGIFLEQSMLPQPDPRVTEAENALVQHTRDKMISGFPGRRSYGSKGTQIVLRTNYFNVTTAFEDKVGSLFYRYDVDHRTELSKQKRRRLFDQIMRLPVFQNVMWATDYSKILVTREKINLDELMEGRTAQGWKEITLPPETVNGNGSSSGSSSGSDHGNGNGNGNGNGSDPLPEHVSEARARNTFGFKVQFQSAHDLREIVQYLQSRSAGATFNGGADMIQLLNIIVTKPPNEANAVANVGQNKFYPFHGHPGIEDYDLGNGLTALRGYFASVRPAVNRLLVNLNVTAGAFFKPGLVAPFVDVARGQLEQQEAFLRMVKVKASYVKDGELKPFMMKIKTIVGFAKEMSPPTFRIRRFANANEAKFRFEDTNVSPPRTRETSVAEYFRTYHRMSLRRPDLPVLNVGTRADPQYMPAELCEILPGQSYRRLLSGDQTSEMLRFAARFPNLNAESIAGTPGFGLRLFRLNDPQGDPQANSVAKWGFRVETSMITVPGRVLNSPQVTYAAGSKPVRPQRGSWNLMDVRFAKPGRFSRWQVLVINHAGYRGNALQGDPEHLIRAFEDNIRNYGIVMGQRGPTQTISLDELTVANRETNDRTLKQYFVRGEQNHVDIFLVILPDQDKWLYARIKFFGDVEHGIHTICSIGNKISKTNGQGMYFGNLALKFNLKGGGVAHTVANTVAKPVDNNTILFGIDVTHPSPGSSEGTPSIACVVASVDANMFQWPGSLRTQRGRKEMVTDLKEMVLERLDLWQKRNQNRLPSKVVVYRDGVSEGQYERVLEEEWPSFEAAFTERYGSQAKWPKSAVIIVGKRHHTRFYPTRKEEADYNPQKDKGSWNPQPGTIVDRGIAGKVLQEFWLQAHQGLQGTARPAHYVVLKNELSFEADELQQFTHHLCYLFNRATKAVSICPPAYYADLLCERGRAYLFSSMGENHVSDSSVFEAENEWSGRVHDRIAETTWYV